MSHPAVGWGLPLASGGQRPGLLSGTLPRTGRPQQSYTDPGVGGEAERAARAAEGKRRGRPLGGTLALRGGPAAGSAAGCTRLCTSPRFYELQFSPDQNGDAAFCAGSFQDEKKNALLGRVLVPVSHVPGGAAGGRGGVVRPSGAGRAGERHGLARSPSDGGFIAPNERRVRTGKAEYVVTFVLLRPKSAPVPSTCFRVTVCREVRTRPRARARAAPSRPRCGHGGARRPVIDSRGDIDSLCLGGK